MDGDTMLEEVLLLFGIIVLPVLILVLFVLFIIFEVAKKKEQKESEKILDNKWKIIEKDLKEQSERHYIRIK